MQGDPTVLDFLNQALKNELTSINQYFLHARMLDNWGMKRLGKIEYQESIDEMKHADRLVKRILFLEGLPNLQDLGKLFIGEDVKEILLCDLKLEMAAHPLYDAAIEHCESVRDFVSRELLVHIQTSEEEHIDFIEEQLGLIDKMGLQNYIQSATGELNERRFSPRRAVGAGALDVGTGSHINRRRRAALRFRGWFHPLIEHAREHGTIHGLGQEIVHAAGERARAVFGKRIRSHGDHGNLMIENRGAAIANHAGGFESIHFRHLTVHEDEVVAGLCSACRAPRARAWRRRLDAPTWSACRRQPVG